jgi:ABC-type sugar transport system substrate-binding protein
MSGPGVRSFPVATVSVSLLALILLSSCGSAPKETPKTRVAGILFQEDQFFRMVELGMRDAAAKNGVELMVGNSFGAIDKEISLVDSYVAGGVSAVVISPLSRKASVPALERAAARGIKVVSYNTTADTPALSCTIESDQADLGASTGKAVCAYAAARLNGKAKIALIEFMSQAPEQAGMRIDGFKSAIRDVPGIEVVAEQDAWLVQQAAEVVEQIVTAHPDLDIVWAANEGGTVGAVIAVKNTGRAGKIAVFGTDMSAQLGEFLLSDDGILQAVTGQQPFEIGSLAVGSAARLIRGDAVDRSVSLPGILYKREKPDAVSRYLSMLKQHGL